MLAPAERQPSVADPEELRANIFRDMSQQNEIHRLSSEVEKYKAVCLRLKARLADKDQELGNASESQQELKERLEEKFRLESALSKNLMNGVGGLLMGVIAATKPDMYAKIESTLSGLEGMLPGGVSQQQVESPEGMHQAAAPEAAPMSLDSATERILSACGRLDVANREHAARLLEALADDPSRLAALFENL